MTTLKEVVAGLVGEAAPEADWEAAAGKLAEVLRREGAGQHALNVGEPFPDFLLPDTAGHLVSRDELLEKGPLVVSFFRGHWCRFCSASLDALSEKVDGMIAAGASVASITPETGGLAAREGVLPRPGMHVLSDVDNQLAIACGIAYRVPPAVTEALARRGVDLRARQGSDAGLLPIPATFVVDRQGILRWRFVDVDFTRRAEPGAVLQILATLPRLIERA